MKECIIKNKKLEVSIKLIDEDIKWTEIMVSVIASIKGLEYTSKELNNLREQWGCR